MSGITTKEFMDLAFAAQDCAKEIGKLRGQRDTWKEAYEKLLEKLDSKTWSATSE